VAVQSSSNIRLLNVTDLAPAGAEFVDLPGWVVREDFSGLPKNLIERLTRRPNLARHRAAWSAARRSEGAILVSHLPRMTAALAAACGALGSRSPHLAFSFNFTDLPTGLEKIRLQVAFARVDRFLVFSQFEKDLYSAHFQLDPERVRQITWTQAIPKISDTPSPMARFSYVAAIGGEGRDFDILLKAAAQLPHIGFAIVARPGAVPSRVPANVHVFENLPAESTWRIAADSAAVLVPLKSPTTCCGQITIVSAQLLGIPVITSASLATREYTQNCTLFDAGDHHALCSAIQDALEFPEENRRRATYDVAKLTRRYDRRQWATEILSFIEERTARRSEL
jgi:glycosyltransferase involved in cell wall biosynthesis